MNNKTSLPGFTAIAALFDAAIGKGSVHSKWHESDKPVIITQGTCPTLTYCRGFFRMCQKCCFDATAGGTIDYNCDSPYICGFCKKPPILDF